MQSKYITGGTGERQRCRKRNRNIQRETHRDREKSEGRREKEKQRDRDGERCQQGELYLGLSECSFPQLNNNSKSLVISIQLLSLSLLPGAGKENNQLYWRKDQGLKETFERKISLGATH